MDMVEVKELLTLFDESTMKELDLQTEDISLFLSKNSVTSRAQQQITNEEQSQQVVPVKSSAIQEEEPAEATTESVIAVGKTVDSPIVGVAYLSSAPDAPTYKKVGDTVAVGDTLCIVEAMKIMNEIISDQTGKITEILVENEEVVEYGQPLFRIA